MNTPESQSGQAARFGRHLIAPPVLESVHDTRVATILQPLLGLLIITAGLILGTTLYIDWILPLQKAFCCILLCALVTMVVMLRRGHVQFVAVSTIMLTGGAGLSSSLLDGSSSMYTLPFVVSIVLGGLSIGSRTPIVLSLMVGGWIGFVHAGQLLEWFELRRPVEEHGVIAAQIFVLILLGAMMGVANRALGWAFQAIDEKERDRRQMEAELYRAQKLETIGRIAGGFAHDFNNLLSVVMVNADLLHDEHLSEGGHQCLKDIMVASESGRALTSKLLALGRKQVVQAKIVDPSRMIREFESVLGHMAGRQNPLDVSTPSGLGKLKIDPIQLQQIISNLVINSRHASPPGKLIHVGVAQELVTHPISGIPDEVPPGDYLCIKVADGGCGMDDSTLESAFEPFFTTKSPNEGTGLGLSVVQGIVRQSGGWVTVTTAPGEGTEFSLWFPRVLGAETWEPAPMRQKAFQDTGAPLQDIRILFVDDDDTLRPVVAHVLANAGARVQAYRAGAEALAAFNPEKCPDILLSDCRMPGMSGPELVEQLLKRGYKGPVVYFTGFAGSTEMQEHLDRASLVLRKPLSASELTQHLSRCLNLARKQAS